MTLYRDVNGRSPLHYAAKNGNEQVIPYLKELVNTIDESGWTPLHLAAYYGNRHCCYQLVYAGVGVDILCHKVHRAIDYARVMRYRSTAQTLIRFGLGEEPKPWGGKKKKQYEKWLRDKQKQEDELNNLLPTPPEQTAADIYERYKGKDPHTGENFGGYDAGAMGYSAVENFKGVFSRTCTW